MANEFVLQYETEPAIPMTCANGTGIEKGTLLCISDPMTAAAAVENDYIAGVAAEEKIANDGKTKIAVYRRGIFKATMSGGVTCGQVLAASGSNLVKVSVAANVGTKTLGTALETGAHTETILIELNPGANNTAYS